MFKIGTHIFDAIKKENAEIVGDLKSEVTETLKNNSFPIPEEEKKVEEKVDKDNVEEEKNYDSQNEVNENIEEGKDCEKEIKEDKEKEGEIATKKTSINYLKKQDSGYSAIRQNHCYLYFIKKLNPLNSIKDSKNSEPSKD